MKLPSVVSTFALMIIRLPALLNGMTQETESLVTIGSVKNFGEVLSNIGEVVSGCLIGAATTGGLNLGLLLLSIEEVHRAIPSTPVNNCRNGGINR